MTNSDQNTVVGNDYTYEFEYDLPVQIIDEKPLSDTNHTPETVSNCHLTVIDSIVLSDNNNSNLLKQNDPDNVRFTIENCPVNQNHQPGLEENQENHCEQIDGQSSNKKKISSKAVGKDNSSKTPFKEIFTLPVEYLSKTKRSRVEKTGKSKLPSVGTSDEWYNLQLEKEKLKKQQKEKKHKRKRLREGKNKLMEQVKQIQKKRKEEK